LARENQSKILQARFEKKYEGLKLLYHGTSMSNAQSMASNSANRPSNIGLAEELCNSFNTKLSEVVADESSHGFFDQFVFADSAAQSREKEIYTSTGFELAANYASRGPEWRYHLLMYFASKALDTSFNPMAHNQEIETWIKTYAEPAAVVILDASHYPQYPVVDEIIRKFSKGDTVRIPYPLPNTVKVIEFTEWGKEINS
jgi:hypothetical protein